MKQKKGVYTRLVASDIASLINDYMLNLETAEGIKFKSLHIGPNVVTIKIGSQMFLISITDKLDAN